jgi:predicted transcriptional regulator
VEALANRPIACPEHKVRSWLKLLEKGGCIVTGVTKQGSRITRLGEEVLTFLETDKDDVLARIE